MLAGNAAAAYDRTSVPPQGPVLDDLNEGLALAVSFVSEIDIELIHWFDATIGTIPTTSGTERATKGPSCRADTARDSLRELHDAIQRLRETVQRRNAI